MDNQQDSQWAIAAMGEYARLKIEIDKQKARQAVLGFVVFLAIVCTFILWRVSDSKEITYDLTPIDRAVWPVYPQGSTNMYVQAEVVHVVDGFSITTTKGYYGREGILPYSKEGLSQDGLTKWNEMYNAYSKLRSASSYTYLYAIVELSDGNQALLRMTGKELDEMEKYIPDISERAISYYFGVGTKPPLPVYGRLAILTQLTDLENGHELESESSDVFIDKAEGETDADYYRRLEGILVINLDDTDNYERVVNEASRREKQGAERTAIIALVVTAALYIVYRIVRSKHEASVRLAQNILWKLQPFLSAQPKEGDSQQDGGAEAATQEDN